MRSSPDVVPPVRDKDSAHDTDIDAGQISEATRVCAEAAESTEGAEARARVARLDRRRRCRVRGRRRGDRNTVRRRRRLVVHQDDEPLRRRRQHGPVRRDSSAWKRPRLAEGTRDARRVRGSPVPVLRRVRSQRASVAGQRLRPHRKGEARVPRARVRRSRVGDRAAHGRRCRRAEPPLERRSPHVLEPGPGEHGLGQRHVSPVGRRRGSGNRRRTARLADRRCKCHRHDRARRAQRDGRRGQQHSVVPRRTYRRDTPATRDRQARSGVLQAGASALLG